MNDADRALAAETFGADLTDLELEILRAALLEDRDEFTRLAEQYGGLEQARALVRARGIVRRPAPIPRVRVDRHGPA